jgi:hypothetical protein
MAQLLAGDYNNNGVVDAADYAAWRESNGQSVTLPNDTTPGSVNQADYDVWRANFGRTSGSAAALAAVPETTTCSLMAICGIAVSVAMRRRLPTHLARC